MAKLYYNLEVIVEYPIELNFKVRNIFGEQEVIVWIYAGVTTFVGPNASGKTQTLKVTARD